MSSSIFSRLERIYLAVDSTFGTVPTFGNSNACRHVKISLDNEIATLVRRDKTGARTATVGIRGRSFVKWSYEGSLAPSGTNGVIPDFDPILQSIFNTASISAGGGLQYGPFVDTPNTTFSMARYRQPSTVNQMIGFGMVTDEAIFNVGADIAEFSANGTGKFGIESDYFSLATADEKGGLGSFPSEPGTPVTHGGIIAGFTGSFLLGGSGVARIRTAQIKVKTGNVMIRDTFGKFTPDDTMGDVRMVTLSADMYEDDSAGQQAIRQAAITKTPLDASITLGTVSGSTVNFFLKNVQLGTYTTDDSALRFALKIPESRAFGTSITSKDEILITIT